MHADFCHLPLQACPTDITEAARLPPSGRSAHSCVAMSGICRAVGRRSPVKQASNARGLLDGGDSEDAEAGESASLLRGQGLDSVFSHFEGQQQQAQQVRC